MFGKKPEGEKSATTRTYIGSETATVARMPHANDSVEVFHTAAETPLWEARMAAALIEKWGTVAAVPDGEDSSGRAKLRLQTPEEIVDRACRTAELAVAEFRRREWVEKLPTYDQMQRDLYGDDR